MPLIELSPEMGFDNNVPEIDGLRDHCGVWAMWDPQNPNIREHAFIGAQHIQHRGDGGAGAAAISPGSEDITVIRGSGKVRQVFGENGEKMDLLPADSYAIMDQTRWPTDVLKEGGSQPCYGDFAAVGHNGQLKHKEKLAARFGVSDKGTDTEIFTSALNTLAAKYNGDVERALMQILPHVEGAFCFTILAKDKLMAVRDRNGIRPLQLGTTETGGYVVASENIAIDRVPGARWEREVEPAEMVVIDKNGLRSGKWAEADPATCMLEYVYLANKDTMLNGIRVGDARRGFGRMAAKYLMAGLNYISSVPNGGNQGAYGLSEASGVPKIDALVINPEYEGDRTFIQPNQKIRDAMADMKVIPNPLKKIRDLIIGKALGLFDDSLIRATVARKLIPKLRTLGVKRIDMVIGSAMYTGTCELGVDTPDPADLFAVKMGRNVKRMRERLDVDNLTFIPLSDMHKVVGKKVCTACMDGMVPNPIAETDIDEEFKELSNQLSGDMALIGSSQ